MSGHFNTRPQLSPLELLGRAATRSFVTESGCWQFTGALSQGYGTIGHKRATWRVHRLAWIALVGEIPEGLVLDHLCRNRACWNPEHLDLVPLGLNVRRGEGPTIRANRAGECLRGHDMTTPENVYAYGRRRQCAVCVRANAARRRQRAA